VTYAADKKGGERTGQEVVAEAPLLADAGITAVPGGR
jgi:hypothetical protein